MYIQHNIPALNSYRNTKENRKKLEKNLERLASGYRINRAGDDAAGLAISEGMRAMIHGLNQAKDNVSDGINMVRTADGAMQEIHSMLQRMSTLCTASSNGTYNDDDRAIMQNEIEQLKEEINRISGSTDFNGVSLLRGPEGGYTLEVVPGSELPGWVIRDPNSGTAFTQGRLTDTYTDQKTFVDSNGNSTSYTIKHAAARLNFSNLDQDPTKVSDLKGKGFFFTCMTCDRHYSINFTDGTGSQMETTGDHYIFNIGIDGITSGSDLVQKIIQGTNNGNPLSHFTNLAEDPPGSGTLVIYDNRSMDPDPSSGNGQWPGWHNAYFNINTTNLPDNGFVGEGVKRVSGTEKGDVVLQIGDTNSDPLQVDLPNITMSTLGLNSIFVKTQELAHSSMENVQNAITFISGERGRMGSYENRLEHTFNNLTNSSENITAAESRIRDTDMAEEITQYTKNNIINQSAQTMLAQANSMLNTVLSLIQQ